MRVLSKEVFKVGIWPMIGFVGSLAIGALMPYILSHHDWWACATGVLVVTLVFGAFRVQRLMDEHKAGHRTQIESLKALQEKKWEGLRAKATADRQEKVRRGVSDLLRTQRDFGMTEADLCKEMRDVAPEEIEDALRYWEKDSKTRMENGNRWVWLASKVAEPARWARFAS